MTTKLRLRDGESNLLAGLLREDERKSLTGFPGILRLPIVKQLFSNNENTIRQTDIVMLLTPRIIRTHELRAQDLSPIYIGTQSNMSLTGPPATIGGPPANPMPPRRPRRPQAASDRQAPATRPAAPAASLRPHPRRRHRPQRRSRPPRRCCRQGARNSPSCRRAHRFPGMVMPPPTPPVTPPSNVQVFSPPPEPPAPSPTRGPPALPAPGGAPRRHPPAPARPRGSR